MRVSCASQVIHWNGLKNFNSVQYKNKYNPLAAALGYHSVKTSGAQSEGSSTHVAVRLDVRVQNCLAPFA